MLAIFPAALTECAASVLALAAALRHVAGARGDLVWSDVDAVQNGLRRAKIATIQALAEAAKRPADAEAYMRSMGGPESLAAFQAAAAEIEARAAQWNRRLAEALAGLTADEAVRMVTHDAGGITTRHVQHVHYLPARLAEPLRGSTELAELIAAIAAFGA